MCPDQFALAETHEMTVCSWKKSMQILFLSVNSRWTPAVTFWVWRRGSRSPRRSGRGEKSICSRAILSNWQVCSPLTPSSGGSHGAKPEKRPLAGRLRLHYVSSTFNVSFFRSGGGGGDGLLRWPDTLHYWPGLLLSGVCPTRGGPLSSL